MQVMEGMEGAFIAFVLAVIVWIALGSWGASILTRKNYLSSDGPRVTNDSNITHRMGPPSISPQIVLSFLGPVLLILAVVLHKRS